MTHSLIDILFRPGQFFSGLDTEKERMTLPLLILLAGGITAAAYGYLIGGVTAQMMGGAMAGLDTIVLLSSVIGAFLGVFIFWIIWAALVFGISLVFKGSGSFSGTLKVIGYGYLPQVIGTVITLIAAFEYVPKIVVPKITSAMMQDPAAVQQVTTSLMKDPAMVELTQISALVTIVFLLWSANIWIFGLQHARKLSMRDAAICVGIPVIAWIFYLIYTLGVS
jgi:hypothetical protein